MILWRFADILRRFGNLGMTQWRFGDFSMTLLVILWRFVDFGMTQWRFGDFSMTILVPGNL